ncbi:Pre-mRNA splicing factor PRP21 like protein-domain-containing protein [Dipodascopsis tothii]|uniref:Pre-mRNA splicing factor PRP21 like protein-domain-containing protein n=1 Tax=Dipodascopsis tothii TaxID=44089 RepID=UPI0034CDE3A6
MSSRGENGAKPDGATQGGAIEAPVGIIIPPPDIREIIEKTAGYVHRNGSAFEARIRENEKNNTRFSFLSFADPYYPFYEWRLDEHKEGRAGPGVRAKAPEPVEEEPEGPDEPPEFEFATKLPLISAQDLDIVRLTALFVARNGRSFSNLLAQKEVGNFQFDFLRQNHSLHNYYTKLVEQYTKVILPSKALQATLEANVANKYRVLDNARARAEWQQYQKAETQKAADEAEAERISFAQIDWHDFVVVETIEFTLADDDIDLPPPLSKVELEHASLEQKQIMSLFGDANRLRIEEAPPTDEAPAPGAGIAPAVVPTPAPEPAESEEEARIRERQENLRRQRQAEAEAKAAATLPNMRIRAAGSTRLAQRGAAESLQCPRCKELIPAAEYSEHMRIELLDPRWKEEKAKSEARHAISNLNTSDVAANIKRLASARGDLFDPEGNALTPEESGRQKRSAK